MARTDAIVLGAGIVGTSVALHLAKRGLERSRWSTAPASGEETSYGNSGVIEGNTDLPAGFPSSLGALMRVALKRASEANYHLSFLPQGRALADGVPRRVAAANASSRPRGSIRPLFARALAEHETLMEEAGATRYLRKTGWLKVYRSERAFAALQARIRSGARVRPAARGARRRRRAGAGAVAQSGVRAARCSGRRRRASAIRWR